MATALEDILEQPPYPRFVVHYQKTPALRSLRIIKHSSKQTTELPLFCYGMFILSTLLKAGIVKIYSILVLEHSVPSEAIENRTSYSLSSILRSPA